MAAETASHRGHLYVQRVLRVGLALSALLLLVGMILAIAAGQTTAGAVHTRSLLSEGTWADRIIALGLVILASTPVIRVLSLVFIWAHERDRKFVVYGSIVLAILLAAIFSGHGG